MLEKTMKQILIKKVNNWLETITDEEVKRLIKQDLIITGGCFTSMIENNQPKDFDCYFRTKNTVLKVAEYYVKLWNDNHDSEVFVFDGENPNEQVLSLYGNNSKWKNIPEDRVMIVYPSSGVVGDPKDINSEEELGMSPEQTTPELDEIEAEKVIEEEKKEFFPVFISSNAITLSNGIQLIVRFYGEADKIHDTFDYEHCKAYFDFYNKKIEISKEVYELVVNKTLRYTGSKYPVCSVFRLRKFINRGWKINAGQLLKICLQISQLDLMNIDVLEDQLVGVDSLYFMNLIQQFRKQQEEDSNFDLTTEYVISIVDKIF
jgi:hypothetical protein